MTRYLGGIRLVFHAISRCGGPFVCGVDVSFELLPCPLTGRLYLVRRGSCCVGDLLELCFEIGV